MGNKRNSKSVVITIIVTVIVLAVLSVVGIRYLMPYYNQGASTEDMQYAIYKFAVRLFPLLVGIVLIVIASMIAANRDEDVDEDDLLPPNSYDQQLFEVPSDDPVRRPQPKSQPQSEAKKSKEPEVISSDSISDDDFFAIFGEPERNETTIEEVPEPDADNDVIEETADEAETEVAPVLNEESEVESEPEVEPVEEEKEAEEEVPPVEPQSLPAATKTNTADNRLVDAVYALVNKLDEMADLITYEEDEEEDEEPEPEPAPAPQPHAQPAPQPQPVYYYQPPVANYGALEHKIDKLCDSIAMLTELVSSRYVAAAAAPVVQPQAQPEPKPEPKPQPKPEPVKVEEPPVVEEQPKVVAEKSEDHADQIINDYDATDPLHLMKIEFDSAQEDEYDITFAFTKASADKIKMSLSEVADAYEVNKKTVVVIPFLSYDEAMSELDRENINCSQTIFIAAGQKEDFDSLIASKLG